jgi:xanthine dehydrogenase accessory factor
VVRQAQEVLADGQPRLVFFGPMEDTDGVASEGVVRVPMACDSEGSLGIFLEPVLPAPHAVVVGDSELTATLAGIIDQLGWTASVVDDEEFAAGPDTAIVVATQGRWDEVAVQAALATDAGYVGLVASGRRTAAVKEWLRASGVDDAALTRLHAPAGLDLGAVDHREIAVAIVAELVAVRAAGGLRAAAGARAGELVAATTATDPVCGMTVDVLDARHVSEWGSGRVYFCSASCKRSFDTDSEGYALAATSGLTGVRASQATSRVNNGTTTNTPTTATAAPSASPASTSCGKCTPT